MAKFYSESNRPKTIPAPAGSKWQIKYKEVINEKGEPEIKAVGKTNIYEKIQAYKKQCLVYNIIERFENGDITALNKTQGQYLDTTEIPTNINDLNELKNKTIETVNKLPDELKEKIINKGYIEQRDIVDYLNKSLKQEEQKQDEQKQ